MKRYIMKCGHVASVDDYEDKEPRCDLCDCTEVVREVQNNTDGLEDRIALCMGHKGKGYAETPSRWNLPFFQYNPDKDYDEYYCGCWGWE